MGGKVTSNKVINGAKGKRKGNKVFRENIIIFGREEIRNEVYFNQQIKTTTTKSKVFLKVKMTLAKV